MSEQGDMRQVPAFRYEHNADHKQDEVVLLDKTVQRNAHEKLHLGQPRNTFMAVGQANTRYLPQRRVGPGCRYSGCTDYRRWDLSSDDWKYGRDDRRVFGTDYSQRRRGN